MNIFVNISICSSRNLRRFRQFGLMAGNKISALDPLPSNPPTSNGALSPFQKNLSSARCDIPELVFSWCEPIFCWHSRWLIQNWSKLFLVSGEGGWRCRSSRSASLWWRRTTAGRRWSWWGRPCSSSHRWETPFLLDKCEWTSTPEIIAQQTHPKWSNVGKLCEQQHIALASHTYTHNAIKAFTCNEENIGRADPGEGMCSWLVLPQTGFWQSSYRGHRHPYHLLDDRAPKLTLVPPALLLV